MEKIWLKHYPKGVPAEIDVNEYASIREVFEESVAKYATRPAFSCMGKSLTYAELDTLSAAFGAWLQGIGCKKGTRVALMMPNILQYPVCLFGILRAGCTVVNVNPLYTARELQHQLNDSGAEVIVCLENFASVFAQVRGNTKIRQPVLTSVGELLSFKGLLVDFVLRRVKKAVPAFSIPGAIRLSDALAEGRKRTLEKVPICLIRLGAIDPAKAAESQRTGVPGPSLHSSKFAPLPEPTIKTGVAAMTAAALGLLPNQ